jgi:hypothetical protein
LCELLPMTDRASAQATLLKSFSATAYAFLCYTTDVWDAYNDDIVKLRKKLRILRGGLQLATNNMPQGELLPIPLQRTIGYQHQTRGDPFPQRGARPGEKGLPT